MVKRLKAYWTKFKKLVFTRQTKKWSIIAAAFAVLLGIRAEYVLWRANQFMTEKGFTTLAAEMIYPYRHLYVYREKGCRVMLIAFFESRNSERTDWAAQACLAAGVEIPEAFIALAGVREGSGRQEEAISIYRGALQKFPKDTSLKFKAGRLFAKANLYDEAEKNLVMAAQEVPQNLSVQIDTLFYLVQRKSWAAARGGADRIRLINQSVPTQVTVVMAEAYLNSPDTASAEAQLKAASATWGQVSKDTKDVLAKIAPKASAKLNAGKAK